MGDAAANKLLEIFYARCEARAYLVREFEMGLLEAVDGLQEFAVSAGLTRQIGIDKVQRIMALTFSTQRLLGVGVS